MRVKIGNFWLAGSPTLGEREHSQCGFPIFTPQRSQQRVEGLRWAQARFHDRQNQAWAFDFSTTRHFASITARMNFIASYATAHEWSGAVTIREDTGGGAFLDWQLGGAVITPPQMTPIGVSLTLQYHIEFQQFGPQTAGNYADEHRVADEQGGLVIDQGGAQVVDEGDT